jgi:DNA polymerase V
MSNEVIFITPDFSSHMPLPFADGGVRAGFPSPAQDYVDRTLDLNKELIEHPAATFYSKVVGDSMIDAGICPEDLLVIDRSIDPYDGCTAVCFLNGEFTVKELDLSKRASNVIRLVPHNPNYQPIVISESDQFEIWGVVKFVIHRV